jgi:hypothetical protein
MDFFASGDNLHDMWVSEETLMRTAPSIKNCPLVWKYDSKLDDAYTHDEDEVPCGFVPEKSDIVPKKLADGRTMLTVDAYVWKRYTGALLSFFQRDGGKKPVSVEMVVYDLKPMPDGKTELADFRYEGITILGSFVTPAIPMANATVLSFAEERQEYTRAYIEEFGVPVVNLKVPEEIKEAVSDALTKVKEADAVSKGFAKRLAEADKITEEEVHQLHTFFSVAKNISPRSPGFQLRGGSLSKDWIHKIQREISERDSSYADNNLLTFPYKSVGDMNPALKGISPPITVAQGNEIARQAEAIGSDKKKNGWAIAISQFKKTHKVEDGKWVKKEASASNTKEAMEMSMEKNEEKTEAAVEEKVEVAMAQDTPKSEEKETPAEEKAESPAEEKKEKEEGTEKKFEFPTNFDMAKMGAFFAEEEDEMCKMASAELERGEFANPAVVMGGMFAKMCKMAELVEKMAEDSRVYMAELEGLRKFKAETEVEQKKFAVSRFLTELSEKVVIPAEAEEEMLASADKYEFSKLDEWRTECKAKSFEFAVKRSGKSDVQPIGLPFAAETGRKKDDLWK